MLLDSAIRERRGDPPDGGPFPHPPSLRPLEQPALYQAPPVLIRTGQAGAPPPLGLVPVPPERPLHPGSRWLAPATNLVSILLHGAALAGFLAFAVPTLPRSDQPSVEVELVQTDAEPPPAAAAPEPPAETSPVETPPVEIALPPVEDLPLPAELNPPGLVAAAEPPPIDLPPPDIETPPLPAELLPPERPAIDPATVTIDPPPVADLPLPAELMPPPRRDEIPRVAPAPPPRAAPPVRRDQARPPVQRQQSERQPPRRQPPPSDRPPSSASEGRGVSAQASARTATPPPSYLGSVMAQLHRAKPAGSGQRGRAVVRFSIQRSGAAAGIGLAASSGNPAIDQAALAMVRRAAPFPPLPAAYGPASMPLTVPINFR